MSNVIALGVRKRQAAEQLETVTIADIATHLQAKDVQMVEDNDGTEFVHVLGQNDDYISIKCGKKVSLTASGADRIKEVVNNYLIYCGINEGRPWFTFGPKAESKKPIATTTVASLLARVN